MYSISWLPGHCDFPQEITDSIIDCLWDDNASLKACALTHPTWLHRSRHHLHQKVTIDSGSSKKTTSPDYYDTPAAQYIRELKLVSPPRPERHDPISSNIWKIVPRFTEITSLTLLYTSWPGKSYKSLVHVAKNVTHLDLIVSRFDNCDEFFAFIAMFTELESLSLTSISMGSAFGHPNMHIVPPRKLTSLRYGDHCTQPAITQRIADWLAYLPSTPLPTFSLTWRAPSQYGLPQALRALGPRLGHLEMPVFSSCDAVIEGNIGNRLHSLTFSIMGNLTNEKISEMTLLLSQMSSLDVRIVEFRCIASSLVDLDVFELQPLDHILSGAQFEETMQVLFNFSGRSCSSALDQPEAFTELLRKSMRHAHERGVLSVGFNVEH